MKEDIIIQISDRLRELRKGKNITLQEIAEKSGVTKSLVSQIENSRTVPSLLVLINLIKSLEIDLNDFFKDINLNPEDEKVILKKSNDYIPFVKEKSVGFGYNRVLTTQLGKLHIEVVLLDLLPGSSRPPIVTHAFELKYLISGSITYQIGKKTLNMETGDTLFFDGREPHVPINMGPDTATMLIIYFYDEEVQ
jgi:transcriptional regulator with XRE-family HTH domain